MALSGERLDGEARRRRISFLNLRLGSFGFCCARITVARKSRPACGNVAVTDAGGFRRNPEGVEFAVLQVKADPDWLVRQRSQIFKPIPANRMQRPVGRHRNTILRRETWDDPAGLVEHLDSEFTVWIVHIDE